MLRIILSGLPLDFTAFFFQADYFSVQIRSSYNFFVNWKFVIFALTVDKI